jgi:STE24 endopeptidase
MNIYLIIILAFLISEYLLNLIVDKLNIRSASGLLPAEFEAVFNKEDYKKSQEYLKANVRFSKIRETVFLIVLIVFILLGGFNLIDILARRFNQGEVITGLIFAGSIGLLASFLGLPFSYYKTFVIEEKFGFNKTTLKTFIFDKIKGLLLGALIGGVVFYFVVWFFLKAGSLAWLYCWFFLIGFQLFLLFIGPVLILPLFNKFTPLEPGSLRNKIQQYAASQRFALKDIFKVDASRRSSKSNAFFTGFGKNRRIALFDTLIERHTEEELVSVIAHEIGHYKKKHIFKQMFLSVLSLGLMFFVLSFFLNNPRLFEAFKTEHLSVYAGIVFFSFLYTPLSKMFSIISNFISRKNEFQADEFSVVTYRKPESFIAALKKLSADNLSNLTPHPAKVFIDYSHPPVLERIKFIRKLKVEPDFDL